MKTTKKSITLLLIAICAAVSFSYGQTAIHKPTNQERKTPTVEEINRQSNAITPEQRKADESVRQRTKKLGESTDAAMWFYQLEYTKKEMAKKFDVFINTYPNVSNKEVIVLLKELLNDYKTALKEVNNAANSTVNFTDADKNTLELYKDYYKDVIQKVETQIERQIEKEQK